MSDSHPPVQIDGHSLTLETLEAVARRDQPVSLTPESRERIARSAKTVDKLAHSGQAVYGVNTGYGAFAGRRINGPDLAALPRNLIRSHAVGLGEPFPLDVTRAAILVRANTLAQGLSGIRAEWIDALLSLLAQRAIPPIPSQGSLGSSGDLAPLAHLALALLEPASVSDDPPGWFQGDRFPWPRIADRIGLVPLKLAPKEGLALTNGATFAAAILALACIDVKRVLFAAEAATALSLEALRGVSAAFDERLHAARPHPGQQRVARRVRELTAGSRLLDTGGQVQDAYSLRCAPQVLGPVWDTLEFAEATAVREINAATDNPLFFGEEAISGGNFHGEPVGLACDYLKIAASEVGAISERRTFRLLSEHTSRGLPPMLVKHPERAGLESGLMMLQYTAASLVLENEGLATPASVRSLPTSADQEDHNANATTAARELARIVTHVERILAIELLAAAQAIDLRRHEDPAASPGTGTLNIHRRLRQEVPELGEDAPMSGSIETIVRLLRTDDWLRPRPG